MKFSMWPRWRTYSGRWRAKHSRDDQHEVQMGVESRPTAPATILIQGTPSAAAWLPDRPDGQVTIHLLSIDQTPSR